jgi:hypothetical protein
LLNVFFSPLFYTQEKNSKKYIFFYLATTNLKHDYCTKDNCTNNTLTGTGTPLEEIEDEHVERACDTLFMCIVTTLNKGLRNGGGIGDVLRQPSSRVRNSFIQVLPDMV